MSIEKDNARTVKDELPDIIDVMPAGKLDADQYMAEDLDGVTESVFGSGNVSYASLQAAQTDAILSEGGVASKVGIDLPFEQNGLGSQARQEPLDSDRSFNDGDIYTTSEVEGQVAFTGTTVGSLSASTLSSDVGAFSDASNLSLGNTSFAQGNSNSSSRLNSVTNEGDVSESVMNIDNSVVNNHDETHIINGTDGEVGLDLDTDVLDTVFGVLNVNINNSIEGALNLNVVTENLTTIVNDLTGISIPVFASPTIEILFDLFNNAEPDDGSDVTIVGLDLPDISLDALESIVGDIDITIDLFKDIELPALSDITLDNVFDAVQSLDIAAPSVIVDTVVSQTIEGTLNVVLNQFNITQEITSDAEVLLGDLGISLSDVNDSLATFDAVAEVLTGSLDEVVQLVGLGDGSFFPPGDGEDSDLEAAIDLGVIDQDVVDDLISDPLEPLTNIVEDIVGDIDLGVDAGLELLGGDPDADDENDVSLDTDIDLIDTDIVEAAVEAVLDPIEEIVGDIDLDIDLAADILGDAADPLVDDGVGGSGEDSLLSDIGDAVSEIVDEVVVDPVTDLLGEPDLEADILADLSPVVEAAEALVDEALDDDGDVEDVVGDILGDTGGLVEDLLDDAATGSLLTGDGESEDTDVVADIDLGVVDQDVVDTLIDNPVEPLTDTVEDLAGDVDLDLGLGAELLGGEADADDENDVSLETDVDLVDTDIVEAGVGAVLDPVEEVVGDLDVDIDLSTDALGEIADPVIDDAEGGTGEDTLISEVGNLASDIVEEAVVEPITKVIGEPDLEADVLIDLAPEAEDVDALLDDIDLDLGSSLDLLDNAVEETGKNTGIEDDISWTESTIEDGGGLFDDVINGIGGDGDVLPDPVGTVAEGLGVLDVDPEIDVGSLGGLF